MGCRVPCDDISMHGGWSCDRMRMHYIDNTPNTTIKCLLVAGCEAAAFQDPTKIYFEPRFIIDVPESLLVSLYPHLPKLEEDAAADRVSSGHWPHLSQCIAIRLVDNCSEHFQWHSVDA